MHRPCFQTVHPLAPSPTCPHRRFFFRLRLPVSPPHQQNSLLPLSSILLKPSCSPSTTHPPATSTSGYFTTMDDAAHAPSPFVAVGAVVALSVYQEFDYFQVFKAAVHAWAFNSNHPVRLGKSDRPRNVFCCRTSADCEFKVRAIWKANKEMVCCTVAVGLCYCRALEPANSNILC